MTYYVGYKGSPDFNTLEEAITHAKERLLSSPDNYDLIAVWSDVHTVVAVVTDDANGITVHHLQK